ncbi:hypothetical protein GGX14DRAFT_600302 [Mycena pura]|uniref:F-box domain-containing protein n=1 Tax=Mycena pura TaxID=153505 RepID=A0AAD6UP69_9AGAR|nr:hypothetical protein GGX14DRAFT_600302 [Mycena pura]
MVRRRQQPGSHRPTVSETSALAADRAQIARLDGQFLALQRSLRAVQEERARVQERLDGYIYPIFTLPNEIVAEIFLRFLPVYLKRPPSSGILSPMMLGQICHRWREIAWSAPALWRAISVHCFTPFSKGPRAGLLPLLEGWMTRAASLPLSISLFLEEDDDDTISNSEEDDDFDDAGFRAQLVQTLVSQCSRWEHVKLAGIMPEDLKLFVGHRMPLLRSLGLVSGTWDQESVFQDVPLLRSLTLSQQLQPSFLPLPFSQLTTLVMTSAYEPVLLDILSQTVNLIHFRARLFRHPFRAEMYKKVKLEFLQSLCLLDGHRFAPSHSVFMIIHALTVPALRTMRIHQKLLGSAPLDTLNSLVARSGCRLQTLCLRGDGSRDHFPPDDLLRAAFPTIQIIFEAEIHRQWHHVRQEEGESSEDDECLESSPE